jgi:hypothetical protein
MSLILVAAFVAGTPEPLVSKLTPRQAAEVVAAELPTGSLIFSRGDCLAVKIYSVSPYTHVGAVVERGGKHSVYDSTGGAGVRKQALADYLAAQTDAAVYVYRPEKPFSDEQRVRFEEHLEAQLGRPYAIVHHLTGERRAGLHCSEYATDALVAADLLEVDRSPRVSPAGLRKGIVRDALYRHVATYHLEPERPQPEPEASWCSRMWSDTKECTGNCYRKMRSWVCCK